MDSAFTTDATLTDLADILRSGAASGRYAVPDDWLQGRTTYGGLSSAIALDHVLRTVPDLPPLRSAMIAFVGPIAGAVQAAARTLRRGRNAVFVDVELTTEAGVGFAATLVFVAARASAVTQPAAPAPSATPPGPGDAVRRGPAGMFLQNFEIGPNLSQDDAGWLRWVRLAERARLDPMVELLAVGDALPPAAMRLTGGPAPVSSMTWQCNLLTDRPATEDGWWLISSISDAAADGCSSQTMAIWNAAGDRVASGMQSVALFV